MPNALREISERLVSSTLNLKTGVIRPYVWQMTNLYFLKFKTKDICAIIQVISLRALLVLLGSFNVPQTLIEFANLKNNAPTTVVILGHVLMAFVSV